MKRCTNYIRAIGSGVILGTYWPLYCDFPGYVVFRVYRRRRTDEIEISKPEAQEFDLEILTPIEQPHEDDKPFEAVLKVYSPVYDLSAPRWRFWYNGEHYYMDVSEFNIRSVVLENGGALVDDAFKVMLVKMKTFDASGIETESFKVLNVTEFVPAYRQADLFLGQIRSDIEEDKKNL